jgi:L-lactate dehydrogenase complex protein LldG
VDHRGDALAGDIGQLMAEDDVQRLLDEFREKAEPLGVIVLRGVSDTAAAQAVADWARSLEADGVIVASEVTQRVPAIEAALTSAGVQVRPPASPADTRDSPLGLSLGLLAIAETGSVLLSEPTLEDRAIGMLTLAQATICPTAALVSSLDDSAPLIRELSLATGGAFSTLVTGPSRTADIERVLTVGVQGPGKIMTLFVDDL